MNIITATNGRPEIAEVWCAAIAATLMTPHEATILYRGPRPRVSCAVREVASISATIGMEVDRYASGPVLMYLEEDMIAVRQWGIDDYPGRLVAAQGNAAGQPWPSLVIKRGSGEPMTAIVPQRFVRDGGCPDWLPGELCDPALKANAKVLGSHFIHLDKMYRPGVPQAAAKNELLQLLAQRFRTPPIGQPGLGDMVAAGLTAVGITKQRVQAVASAVGVKDCGCAKRQASLNRLGERFGIGGGEGSP